MFISYIEMQLDVNFFKELQVARGIMFRNVSMTLFVQGEVR